MTAWDDAVEAGCRAACKASTGNEWAMFSDTPLAEPFRSNVRVALTAALPAIRRMLAEELHYQVVPPGPTDYEKGWLDAADHLTRKEVL